MLFHFTLLLAAALAPGAAIWWTGRRLLGRRDDAALPELLVQRRSRLATVVALALAVVIVVGHGAEIAAAIALLVVGQYAGSYPMRRALLDETWGFGTYLWVVGRRVVGTLGLWIAIALVPLVVLAVPERWSVPVAVGVVVLLLVWSRYYLNLWLRLYQATPLAEHPAGAALAPRFAEIVARSSARAPDTFRIGHAGERLVGAFVVPSLTRPPAVAFGAAALDLLAPDEAVAVFAHEVAHLEHYTPARLRRGALALALLAVLGVALALFARRAAPSDTSIVAMGWPLIVVVALALRASRSRAHEYASDRRAAELCGDPEAMVRALVVLHAALYLPRRWSADAERAASHPSLANRIRALRVLAVAPATATASVAPRAPVVLRSTTPGTYVVLDASRVHVLSDVPDGTPLDAAALLGAAASSRAEAYERLVELRVAAKQRGALDLVATPRRGAAWRVPLVDADVRAAQAALDEIDTRLAPATAGRSATARKVAGIPARSLAGVAAALAALALLAFFVGGDRSDAAAPLPLGRAEAVPVARVVVDGPVRDLRLSPSATYAAARELRRGDGDEEWDDDEEAGVVAVPHYVIFPVADTTAAAPRRRIAASDLAFVDDARVLALGGEGRDSLVLRIEPVATKPAAAGKPLWAMHLPPLAGARLRLSPPVSSGGAPSWTVVGRDWETNAVVALSGRVGATGDVTERRWGGASPRDSAGAAAGTLDAYPPAVLLPASDGGALGVRFRGGGRAMTLLAVLGRPTWTWELWRYAGAQPERLFAARSVLSCGAAPADSSGAGATVACIAQDRHGATLWAAGASGSSREVGRLRGWYGAPAPGALGRVAVPAVDGSAIVLVEPGGGTSATRFALPGTTGGVQEVAWASGGLLAELTTADAAGSAYGAPPARYRQAVVVYRLP
ncbi:MAG TPA: M48 family metalloprotease [Gemmatimonadaceae bacterium]|nr:M48 family metalloprotease [Gemmatimonadaceae bacterium]